MRLFVAVDLPETVKGSLDAALAPLHTALPSARWVGQSGFHLTLAFLGEVEGERVAAITRALREKLEQEGGFAPIFPGWAAFPMPVRFESSGPGSSPVSRFSRLAERVQDALRVAAVPSDDKPFRSHITLARCNPPWPGPARTQIGELAEGLATDLRATPSPATA